MYDKESNQARLVVVPLRYDVSRKMVQEVH